ncbi:MAG TPA: hypothetical protein EYP78_04745, partial [Candidatus Omnitrophica bacterium]|nr:hypothetical protein [Candidatus Omnitrophota bacterium]
YEADDILATLACKAEDKYDKIILVSSDKDILQVVTETINVLNPFHSEGLFNPQKVKKTLGVLPEKVPDLLALIGDTIDNIPGIPGIGKKTASKLLNEFGSVENVIAYKEKIKRQKIRENIERNSSNVLKNKRLTTLSKTVPMDVNWEELYLKSPDWSRLKKIFEILGFKKFLRELEPTLFS